jgi:alpha-galactosidase
MLVLDDGWFGKRDDATTSLGDWEPDVRKFPRGMKALVDDVNGLGVKFGLWIEPEMLSVESDLYNLHPDWCLHVPKRPTNQGRNQLVLDMSRKEVCLCFACLCVYSCVYAFASVCLLFIVE